jgi:hypothetical protein
MMPRRSYAALDGKGTVPLDAAPTGLIVLWRGDKAPEGWVVCDGENGTPDLTAHVPKGRGYRIVYIQKT